MRISFIQENSKRQIFVVCDFFGLFPTQIKKKVRKLDFLQNIRTSKSTSHNHLRLNSIQCSCTHYSFFDSESIKIEVVLLFSIELFQDVHKIRIG
jgi:hypothetical protein